jgi:formylglycine-generating enzyme required for sulfatase activity
MAKLLVSFIKIKTAHCMPMLILFNCYFTSATEAIYPFWDGEESIVAYGQRAGLEPTMTINLGNNVTMEFVLIPAGKFIMGRPEPESPWIGGTIAAIGAFFVGIMSGYVAIRSIRRRRFQFSLRWLIGIVFALAIVQFGGFRCWEAKTARSFMNWVPVESPARMVTIRKPFYIGKYEVTQVQYEQIMGKRNDILDEFIGDNKPVINLSWDEAEEFCRRATLAANVSVELPSEAEWEYAARAGEKDMALLDWEQTEWYEKNSKCINPVGLKKANGFGLHDMLGNVRECCEDDWHSSYFNAPVTEQAWIDTPRSTLRVSRGGSWVWPSILCRPTLRGYSIHDSHGCTTTGFRVAIHTL